ncbi:MAG: NlpC/P60 family protein [Oscillospiraceae bacterium]|nr:NlpC/P60 family protein [Oscillospiraceae bacterium]
MIHRKICKGFVAFLLAFALFLPAALAEYAVIGITNDNLRLREEPSLSAKILTTAPKGSSVTVTQKDPVLNTDGEWYSVIYNGTEGYMSAPYLDIQDDGTAVSLTGTINEASVNFRTEPNTNCAKILVFSKNTKVEVTGTVDGWYAVTYDGKNGYVRCDLITLDSEKVPLHSEGVAGTRRNVVEFSLNYLGKPYQYGAAGPNSFDCSGFTTFVFKQYGVSLNRSSKDQYKNGSSVSKSDLLPGDLVFFRTTASSSITHVGLYIGGGDFIHASSGTGKCVKISSLTTGYYYDRYVGARRVL